MHIKCAHFINTHKKSLYLCIFLLYVSFFNVHTYLIADDQMTFNRNIPYNDLPLLPPLNDLETKRTLKAAIAANKALAQLKTRGELLPNQYMLIDNLVLLEAKDSSEIENIFTTNDKLYQADAIDSKVIDPNTKEVRRYRQALWHGVRSIKERPLGINTFIEIYQIIKENNSTVRKTPGTKISSSLGEVIYTPPEGYDLIMSLLGNLEKYIHQDDEVDPLIKMAVLHYQFEAIHPFSDGNGRTGRILNILYLLQKNLLDVPVLFLSSYIMRHKTPYYLGLQNITKSNNWEEWVLYIMEAIEITSYETIARIDTIRNAMSDYELKLRKLPIYSRDLLEVLFEQPYCTIHLLVEKGVVHRNTASSYLRKLCEAGLLSHKKIGRNNIYINHALMNILNRPPEKLYKDFL